MMSTLLVQNVKVEEFAHLKKKNRSLDINIPQLIENSLFHFKYAIYSRICSSVGDKNINVPKAL